MENTISFIFIFVIEAIILLQYSSRLFSPKHSVASRLSVLSLLYILLFMISLCNIKWLNMFSYLLANFLFLITQYDVKWSSAAFHSTLLAAVMGMCELIVYNIIERTSPHFFMQVDSFHNTILLILCSKISFFSVIYLLTHLFKSLQDKSDFNDNSVFLLIIIPVTSVFIMLTFVNINDHYTLTAETNWLVSLSALFLLVINLLIFGINQYSRKKNRDYTEMQLLLQKENDFTEYYKMLLSQSENQAILIHDMKKHLQSIAALNEQNAPDKVNAYIHQLFLSSDLKETARVCDNELLNAIMARYKRQCDDMGIIFSVDIRSGVLNFMSDSDLTSLFCNLLDNATEAAKRVPESYVEINISKRENTPFVLITVVNSCRVNPFRGNDGILISTKPDKHVHGFGIKSIQKVCKNYDGDIQMYYSDDTLTFHTIITIRLQMSHCNTQ